MPKTVQFASFTLDLNRLSLFGPSGHADLRPKSFEVLRYLVEHAGRVVGKEEVIKAVWPDVTVTDESLTRCISEVRRAIDDGNQQIIKTVPKRGYLFDVPILANDVTTPASQVVPNREAETANGDVRVGERKHVTVLYADLKESLERIVEHDPDEALKVFEAVLTLMTQAVLQYEGTVNVVSGDGIIATFGVPLTHEDHAVRACYAAILIQETVTRYSQGLQNSGAPAGLVRIGLDSGEAVIRSIANGTRTNYRVMGWVANVAARLGQMAAPGNSFVSAETLRLAEGHVEVKAL